MTTLDIPHPTQALVQNILENITQGILFIDLRGIVTIYNKAAETILGIPKKKVIDRAFVDHFKDHIFGFSIQEAIEKKLSNGPLPASYVTPTGSNSDLEITSSFVQDETSGMIIMIRDVTELHYLQNLATRADRLKVLGEMAAHVAHEIRNPLGGIKGFASLLKRDLSSQPQLQQMAAYIVEGTDNLSRLVNQVLHYTRPVQPQLEKTELMAILNDLKQHVLADTTFKQKIDITINSPFKEATLSLDPLLFRTAILNLLVNAVQAMPKGGKISLSVNEKHGQLNLVIADNGIGIPEEHLAKLYWPFFTTKPEGNGLGLADVQKIIQAHEGAIDVTSKVNHGTTFTITLPKGTLR